MDKTITKYYSTRSIYIKLNLDVPYFAHAIYGPSESEAMWG